jgi:hypothetical protein
MLDLSKLSSPFCAAGRAMRRREELLRRRSADALRGDDQALSETATALALAEAMVARHARVRVAGGPVSTRVRPGGRVVTGPSISLEIHELPAASGPEEQVAKSLLARFLLDLLALFRAAVQPGQLSITDLPFVASLHGGRTIPSLCLTPRLAARPRPALAF